jgi:hypothetical protein
MDRFHTILLPCNCAQCQFLLTASFRPFTKQRLLDKCRGSS